jgi:phage terminase large subunit
VEQGINAARVLFARVWIDEQACGKGIESLMNYRWDYNAKLGEFKSQPVHDWASHGADAFRYLAVAHRDENKSDAAPINYKRLIR